MARIDALVAERPQNTEPSVDPTACNTLANYIEKHLAEDDEAKKNPAVAERYLSMLGLCMLRPDKYCQMITALQSASKDDKEPYLKLSDLFKKDEALARKSPALLFLLIWFSLFSNLY